MNADAKENPQPQSIEERLTRLEKTVDLLHDRADNFDVIWQLMKNLADAPDCPANLPGRVPAGGFNQGARAWLLGSGPFFVRLECNVLTDPI